MSESLLGLLREDHVLLGEHVDDWRSAIRRVAKPLQEDGSVSASYVDAMIAAVDEYGAYIVLSPHVAIAHARPEHGVNRLAMSALSLRAPVAFGHREHDPVSLVFCLAAPDDIAHLDALRVLVKVIAVPDRVQRLIDAPTPLDFCAVLSEATASGPMNPPS